MATRLEPIKKVKCTYKDCAASFDTEKEMRAHKKNSPEHDYCSKCKLDFGSLEELNRHKSLRPDMHNKACRICGTEMKSDSGLKRHIELYHKVDQRLPCLGCKIEFFSASQLVEHMEFGHCPEITAVEYQGLIVHKFLVADLLKGGPNLDRFMQKISEFDAAIDEDDEGGVSLLDGGNNEALDFDYKAIEPEVTETPIQNPAAYGPYPPLPSSRNPNSAYGELSSRLGGVSLDDDNDSVAMASTIGGDSAISSTNQTITAWNKGGSARTLFPHAKPTPAPSEWSVQHHDQQMEATQGINIMKTRFWDPVSKHWNPERFYDTILQRYHCPFVCEQNFDIPSELQRHIMTDHRISMMRCPSCLGNFASCTALVAHCESGSRKCNIRKANDYGTFLDRLTGGFLGVEECIRDEFIENPAVLVTDPETGRIEKYNPPTATFLKYRVTKPVDWEDREERAKIGYSIGGPAKENRGLLD